jgi:hypothetical protein
MNDDATFAGLSVDSAYALAPFHSVTLVYDAQSG